MLSTTGGFSDLDPLVTVQEWVEGGEENLLVFGSYCGADHEVAGYFTARKSLQYPPLAGTGIVVEALPLPQLEEPSRALLRALAFRGISEIEYKLDDRDGALYLIEVNPRHWDQHGLGTAVGVNLSELLYRDMTGQPMRAMRQSTDRVRWIAEAEYARHLARCLLGRAPWSDAGLALGASRTWAVYNPADPGPFLSLLGLRSACSKSIGMASLRHRMASGARWTVSIRVVERVIGFVSTLVLARLLAPPDFGVVAMGTAIQGILSALTEFGFTKAIIRMQRPQHAHYSTAFTLNAITSALVAVGAAGAIPAGADLVRRCARCAGAGDPRGYEPDRRIPATLALRATNAHWTSGRSS